MGDLEANSGRSLVLAAFGGRAHDGDLTTLEVKTKRIGVDGRLYQPLTRQFGREAYRKWHERNGARGLERFVEVWDQYVIVSIGLRASPGDVTTMRGVYGELYWR